MSSRILPRPAKGSMPEDEGASRAPSEDFGKRPLNRSKTTHACQQCRSKRRKCSGEKPSCKACRAQGLECIYVHDDLRLRTVRSSQVQHQQERIQSLESTLASLITSSEPEAIGRLRQLRAEEASSAFDSQSHDSSSSRSESSFFPTAPVHNTLLGTGTFFPETQTSLNQASLQGQLVLQRFDVDNLPPRQLIETALTAFVGWSSSLSLVMTPVQCYELIAELYDGGQPVEACLLSEISALAALGTLQLWDQFRAETREALISTAQFYLDQCRAVNQLRALSIEHCLDVYRLKERNRVEDMSIVSTLQLPLWMQQQTVVESRESEDLGRYYRTLRFLRRVLQSGSGQEG